MEKGLVFVYSLGGSMYINLTNKCCNDCEFCLRRNGDGIKGSTLWLKSEPTSEQVISAIKNYGEQYSEAVFCGYGESTYKLNEMIEVSKYLHSIGKKTRLNTNGLGSQIYGENIVPLLKGNIDRISVSLNESSAQKYNNICHSIYGEDAYGFIIDFTKKCIEENINTVMSVVDVISKEDIEVCRETAKSIGCPLRVRANITNNKEYN